LHSRAFNAGRFAVWAQFFMFTKISVRVGYHIGTSAPMVNLKTRVPGLCFSDRRVDRRDLSIQTGRNLLTAEAQRTPSQCGLNSPYYYDPEFSLIHATFYAAGLDPHLFPPPRKCGGGRRRGPALVNCVALFGCGTLASQPLQMTHWRG
jgi:hypothetical protein